MYKSSSYRAQCDPEGEDCKKAHVSRCSTKTDFTQWVVGDVKGTYATPPGWRAVLLTVVWFIIFLRSGTLPRASL